MLLAIDMGNTNIVISCIDGRNIAFVERISTDISRTELEYAISFKMARIQLTEQSFHLSCRRLRM